MQAKFYDQIDREQCIVTKASKDSKINPKVPILFSKNYDAIIFAIDKICHKSDKNPLLRCVNLEVVADTLLYLTYKYNEDVDFVKQFVKSYKMLAGAFVRGDKIAECNILSLSNFNVK